MSTTILAHYDGTAIVPDSPIAFPAGQRLRVHVEAVDGEAYPLSQIARLATDMGVSDLAEKHLEYARPRDEKGTNGRG